MSPNLYDKESAIAPWVAIAVIAIAVVAVAGAYLALQAPTEPDDDDDDNEIPGEYISGKNNPNVNALDPEFMRDLVDWAGPANSPWTPVGPYGETPLRVDELVLTEAELAILKGTAVQGFYTAATIDLTVTLSNIMQNKMLLELGVAGNVGLNSTESMAEQNDFIRSLIPRTDVDFLIIEAWDTDGSAPACIDLATANPNIGQVFLWGAVTGIEQTTSYLGTSDADGYGTGVAGAEMIVHALGGEGKIGMIEFALKQYVNDWRKKGAHDTFDKYPDIEVVDIKKYTDTAEARELAMGMLQAHPEIEAIWVQWTEPCAFLAAEAVETLGREREIIIVSNDLAGEHGTDKLIDPDSPIIGLIDSKPPDMGANAVRLAMKYAAGSTEFTHSYICTIIRPISIYNLEWGYQEAMMDATIPDALLARLVQVRPSGYEEDLFPYGEI